jgi:UDP-N-acetylmuramate: L-alanyl-gamma-D-glutamyl-meso-diaminopimelate ligase
MSHKEQTIYFLGIGGTGMASCAGLAKEAGYHVVGSDQNIYPPMSTMLEEIEVDVLTPYSKENIEKNPAKLYVIANALSRGNEELEYVLSKDLPYTSFPAMLGDLFLQHKTSVVVAGTHGKTTTTSLLAHVLKELGFDPGFLVGGIPKNFPRSYSLTSSDLFVIEGDEYDTAFFDKGSKFLHYHPKFVIFNNLEFDHADIFADLAAIESQFSKLLNLVPNPRHIIANVDDPGVTKLLGQMGLMGKVTKVSAAGGRIGSDIILAEQASSIEDNTPIWRGKLRTKMWGEFNFATSLVGPHNMANIAQVIGCVEQIALSKDKTVTSSALANALLTFKGVARRLDFLGTHADIDVYEDFAHHPTAVKSVIQGFRKSFPSRKLLVAFEPRNATSRRNTFLGEYAEVLALADKVYIGECPLDKRIAEDQRMDTSLLCRKIGTKAHAFNQNQELLTKIVQDAKAGDTILYMSSGSFSGIQHQTVDRLKGR